MSDNRPWGGSDQPPADQPGAGQPQPGYGQPPPYGQPPGLRAAACVRAAGVRAAAALRPAAAVRPAAAYGQPAVRGTPGYGQAGYGQPGYGAQPPGGGWAAPAPMPGGVPLRPLTVGDMLSGAFTLVRRNPVATLGLAAIVETLAGIATVVLSLGEQSLIRGLQNAVTRDNGLPDQAGHDLLHFFGSLVPYIAASIAVALVVQSVLTGMLTGVFGRGLIGDKISIGQAWQISRAFWVLVVSLLTILIMLAPPFLLALIVIGLAVAKISAAADLVGVIGGIALIPLILWIA